jgi:hypothetical protein
LRGPLVVLLFRRVEIVNDIGLALALGFIAQSDHKAALAALDDDFAQGRLTLVDISWRDALCLSDRISRKLTPSLSASWQKRRD